MKLSENNKFPLFSPKHRLITEIQKEFLRKIKSKWKEKVFVLSLRYASSSSYISRTLNFP